MTYGSYENEPNPYYPPTSHPEDNAYYGHRPEPRRGFDVIHAVKWGATMTFRNAGVWIGGVAAFMGVVVVLAMVVGMASATMALSQGQDLAAEPDVSPSPWVSLVSGVLGLLVGLIFVNASVRQLDRPKTTWRDFVEGMNVGPLLTATLILTVGGAAVMAVLRVLFTGSLTPTTGVEATMSELVRNLTAEMGISFLVMLVSPLFLFVPFYVADRQAGVADAFRRGVAAGARHYLPLLALVLVAGIALLVTGMITLGLIFIIAIPIYELTVAHLYRQAAGLPVPADVD